MSNPFRLLVVKKDGDTFVYEEGTLALVGLDTDEACKAAFGEDIQWRKIWLKPALGKHAREIAAKCRVPDPLTGFSHDSTLEPPARCAVMVEKWEGFEASPSVDAFDNLPLPLANVIDAHIQAHMYPNILANEDFIKAWKGNSKASEAEPVA